MKRFVIAGGFDDHLEALTKLRKLVQDRQPDGLLFTGGFLGDHAKSHAEKLKSWKTVLDGFGSLELFTALIPGRTEAPLREFLRLARESEMEYPHLHVVHATIYKDRDVALEGLGGDLSEAEERTEDQIAYARTSAEYFLRSLQAVDAPYKILLLSVAPTGQLGGAAGNRICGELIDSQHPSLCAVGGPTEARGSQWIAHTLVVNPGRLADGSVAWVDRSRSKNEQVELVTM